MYFGDLSSWPSLTSSHRQGNLLGLADFQAGLIFFGSSLLTGLKGGRVRPKRGISSGLGTELVQIAPQTSPWEHNPYGSGYFLSVEQSKVDQVLAFGGGEPTSG